MNSTVRLVLVGIALCGAHAQASDTDSKRQSFWKRRQKAILSTVGVGGILLAACVGITLEHNAHGKASFFSKCKNGASMCTRIFRIARKFMKIPPADVNSLMELLPRFTNLNPSNLDQISALHQLTINTQALLSKPEVLALIEEMSPAKE